MEATCVRRAAAPAIGSGFGPAMEFLSTLSFIILYGVSYGLVLFTISIGLVVTMGLMRVLNMAHGVFAALGGYVALSLMNQFSAGLGLLADHRRRRGDAVQHSHRAPVFRSPV